MMLKFLYGFNWFCIGLLALFVLVLLLDPNRGGGDAATKGIGSGLLTAAIIAIVILLGLNLSPWAWTRYVPPVLALSAIVYFLATTGINVLSSRKTAEAVQNRWEICIALIEHGAEAKYQTPNGESCAKYVNQRLKYIEEYESERPQLERLQALLQ